jgi:replicative DNA helicase
MLTLAQYVAKNHGNVLLVSLEERWRSILNKLISERTGLPLRLIRAGKYKDEDFGNIIYQLGNIAEQNLYFLDSGTSLFEEGTTTSTIYSIATHMKSAHGLSAVFVDYLDLVGDTYGRNLYERTTYLSKKLKFIAYDLDVPLFCLCQLSRQVEYRNISTTSTEEEILEERLPKLSDLRNSGGIEENADLVLFLYRNDYYDDILAKFCKKGLPESEWRRQFCRTCDDPCGLVGKADLLIAKQRQGGEIGLKVQLIWNTSHFRYEQAKK